MATVWSFCFSISPSNEYSGLISLRMDWLDLLAVQGTLKSLLQHHSSKALILWHSAFFTLQLSHPYMITGKTIWRWSRSINHMSQSLLASNISSEASSALSSFKELKRFRALFWRRQWQPTPVLLPGKSHGRRSLVGCSPWGGEESTRLNDFTFTFHFHALEKEMATHSSVLAWRIPETGEPGGLLSMGLHRV